MKKNLICRSLFLLVIWGSLSSCRTEDELIQNSKEEDNKFQVFTSRNGKPVNYPQGYKSLLEKYDRIYTTTYTRKTFLENNTLGKSGSEEVVELNIRSQELMMKNNSERWILYPVVKGNEVIGIEVGILKNNETKLEFWRMDAKDSYYKNVIDLFRSAYTEKMLAENTMSRGGGNCGRPGEEPCDTGEVIITVPKPNGPKGDPNLYLPGANPGGSDPGVIGGDCGVYGNCGGGGTGQNQNDQNDDNPCKKAKDLVSKSQVKDSLTSFKNHANINTKGEKGFQELKSGTLQPGIVTADNQIFFGIGPNSLGTVHTHQPGTIGILAPQDIMTFLHIVRQQDPSSLGNAYSGTVSSSGTYFIHFTGTVSDLPPAMTEVQEATYVADLVKAYKEWEDLLSEEQRYSTNFLRVNKPLGLEILLFKLLKKMNLNDKIQLIKEENGNTSTINENTNGTTTPNPC